jgi:hypothetical protein
MRLHGKRDSESQAPLPGWRMAAVVCTPRNPRQILHTHAPTPRPMVCIERGCGRKRDFLSLSELSLPTSLTTHRSECSQAEGWPHIGR